MLKIAHTADWHLRDSQFSRSDRSDDFYAAAMSVINQCTDCDVILHSGDLLDVTRPSAHVMQQVRKLDSKLRELGIPMLVISGNHDKTPKAGWMDAVASQQSAKATDLARTCLAAVRLGADLSSGPPPEDCIRKGTPQSFGGIINADMGYFLVSDAEGKDVVSIMGLPYMPRRDFLNFFDTAVVIPKADILMWHAQLSEMFGFCNENAASVEDFPQNAFQFVAMGDIHVPTSLQRASDQLRVAYCGSIEMCNMTEPFEKTFDVYTFHDGKLGAREPRVIELNRTPVEAFITELDAVETLRRLYETEFLPTDRKSTLRLLIPKEFEDQLKVVRSFVDLNTTIVLPYITGAAKNKDDLEQELKQTSVKPIKDYVPAWFPAGSPLVGVCQDLCDPTKNPADVTAVFEQTRLGVTIS